MDPLKEGCSGFACRVCESKDLLMNIFVNASHQIAEKLCYCASIQVTENDGLPQHICTNCFTDLQISYTFRQRCELTDAKLRAFSNMKILECAINPEETGYVETIETLDSLSDSDSKILLESKIGIEYEPQVTSKSSDEEPIVEILGPKPEHESNIDVPEIEHESSVKSESIDEELIVVSLSPEPELKSKIDVPEIEYESHVASETSDDFIVVSVSPEPEHEQAEINQMTSSFSCDKCNATFLNRPAYLKHIRIHGGEQYQCVMCPERFSRQSELKMHEAAHRGPTKRWPCNQCSKDFYAKAALLRHKDATHENLRNFVCNICGYGFSQKTHLQAHLKVHVTTEPQFKCTKCDAAYKTCQGLKHHEQSHLPPEERDPKPKANLKKKIKKPGASYICSFCGKISNLYNTHVLHERLHTGEKPHSCKVCGKAFLSSTLVRVHMRIHTDTRPYKCETCGKCFRISAHLKTHHLTHTKERKFVCQICSKAYPAKHSLKIHMKCHKVCVDELGSNVLESATANE